MTDTYEPDLEDEQTPRDLRQQLAERAREAEQTRLELEATRRELEFTRALGENASAPWASYFVKGYDGDLNADAIRKAAADAGFLTQGQPIPPQPDDLTGHGRMAANAQGGSGAAQTTWQQELAEADRITDPKQREAAILDVVERYGGTTSRSAQ